jgi:hypothetical protein
VIGRWGLLGLALTACAAAPVPPTVVVEAPAPALSAEPAPARPAKPSPAKVVEEPPPEEGAAGWNIMPCCAALAQMANSAPLAQKPYYMAAAQACKGMRQEPDRALVTAQLQLFLAGARLPGACR